MSYTTCDLESDLLELMASHGLTVTETDDEDWIITWRTLEDAPAIDGFDNPHLALYIAIETLLQRLRTLQSFATSVVTCWSSGDLASAVRALDHAIQRVSTKQV